jgi:hypothetical protein
VADESRVDAEAAGRFRETRTAEANHFVSPHESVVVVECLEVVEVAVNQGKLTPFLDCVFDLGGDLEVPGQTGEWG